MERRIAIICHDHKCSGANMSLLDWLKDFDEKNNIYIVVPRYNMDFCQRLKKIGINNIIIGHFIVVNKRLYKTSLIIRIKDYIKRIYSLTINPLMYLILKIKLRKNNISIIHTNSFCITCGAKIAKSLKVPHVWHLREFMELDHQIAFYEKNIEKYTMFSYGICISESIKKFYERKYIFKDLTVIYDSIEYDYSYKKNRKFMQDGECNIIMVGTLSNNKGHEDAIKAIEVINQTNEKCNLVICGQGPEEKRLKELSKQIENIKFLGYRNDVKKLRKKADIALMCSLNEALGRVTIEAQYYENLIIGANCGCTPYLIDDNITGLLYDKGENNLADKILYAIENKSKSMEIIKNAKENAVQKFSKSISSSLKTYYSKILKDND